MRRRSTPSLLSWLGAPLLAALAIWEAHRLASPIDSILFNPHLIRATAGVIVLTILLIIIYRLRRRTARTPSWYPALDIVRTVGAFAFMLLPILAGIAWLTGLASPRVLLQAALLMLVVWTMLSFWAALAIFAHDLLARR